MKILINTPSLKNSGGVANHYLGLEKFWTEKVKYNTVGNRSGKSGSGKYYLPWDIIKFIFKLLILRPDVVLLNPSLGKNALRRDFIFLKIAHSMHYKVAVMIHGFDLKYAEIVDKSWISDNLNKASIVFVLARAFKTILRQWGVTTKIVLTTTKVDDNLLTGYDVEKSRNGQIKNILFLARIEKNKGIYIAIDSFKLLKNRYPDLRLIVVGSGTELQNVNQYVNELQLKDVEIKGRLVGKDVAEAYINSDLYILPSYGEGMPTSVLEAMAFGLPVFTRKVGGLVDFFEDGKMGYITESLEPHDFASAMEKYMNDSSLTLQTSLYNAKYAKEHFMASRVAQSMQDELKQII